MYVVILVKIAVFAEENQETLHTLQLYFFY